MLKIISTYRPTYKQFVLSYFVLIKIKTVIKLIYFLVKYLITIL